MSNFENLDEKNDQEIAQINLLVHAITSRKSLLLTAFLSAVGTLAIMLLGSVAWRAYLNANRIPVVFETTSGETLTITAKDKSGNQLAVFNAPTGAVLLPDKEIQLDVTASYRLGYKRRIGPARLRVNDFTLPAFRLDDPQSHRWNLNDILWYVNLDITRNGKSANYCIVLRSDGLALIETNSGQVLWTFSEPEKTEWGLKLCRPRRIVAPRLLRTSL